MKIWIISIIGIIVIALAVYPFIKPEKESQSTEIPGGQIQGNESYSFSDVQIHNSTDDCWTVVDDRIYNLTSFISEHPGGQESISKLCGRDGTIDFSKKHGSSEKAKAALESLHIGIIE